MTGPYGKVGPLVVVLLVMAAMFSGCQSGQDHAARATPPTDATAGEAVPAVAPPETAKEALRPVPPSTPPPMPPATLPPTKNTAGLRPLPAIRHLAKPKPAAEAGIVTGAGPGAAEVQDDATTLDAALARLKTGTLAYNTPQQMKMAETAHIVAKIASEAVSVEALKAAMPNDAGTQTVTEATSITPQMKMTLTSADFDITPLSSEEQIVAGTVPTTWAWDIVPKHSGTLRLHLAATIELNGLAKDFTTVDREIAVKVDPADAVGGFVRSNWQWLIATLTALVGGAWKFFSARRKDKAAVSSPGA